MDMYLIPNATERDLCKCSKITALEFCLWVWINSEVYERKVDTRHELLARNLVAAASIKNVKIN